jgi:hypothetical protein
MSEPRPPALTVIRGGEPSDEELAAIVAVVTARMADGAADPPSLRRPLKPWVASGLVKGTRTKV